MPHFHAFVLSFSLNIQFQHNTRVLWYPYASSLLAIVSKYHTTTTTHSSYQSYVCALTAWLWISRSATNTQSRCCYMKMSCRISCHVTRNPLYFLINASQTLVGIDHHLAGKCLLITICFSRDPFFPCIPRTCILHCKAQFVCMLIRNY